MGSKSVLGWHMQSAQVLQALSTFYIQCDKVLTSKNSINNYIIYTLHSAPSSTWNLDITFSALWAITTGWKELIRRRKTTPHQGTSERFCSKQKAGREGWKSGISAWETKGQFPCVPVGFILALPTLSSFFDTQFLFFIPLSFLFFFFFPCANAIFLSLSSCSSLEQNHLRRALMRGGSPAPNGWLSAHGDRP